MTIAQNVAAVRARIADACREAERDPADVTLIAVAKTFPPDAIRAAVHAGVGDIGENRAQELKQKAAVLRDGAIRWHFVGPLQTNKVRSVVGTASLIHSVDRPGLAAAIARRAHSLNLVQDVLVEVNLAGEATKSGVEPPRTRAFAAECAALDGMHVRGLMAIPPRGSPDQVRDDFRMLARLRDEVAKDVPSAIELSMGMTEDFEIAIAEGATFVRVGRAIFGPRNR
ncbi:MAG: YggS family pyridoxal phosphate-dependent enzyme [Actinomycetota bacterium]|nr:YggS family pyridoxal phosphate-dependent enzyme [Actinomycetota bacterium]